MLVNNKRIIICDPCFGNLTGHWENYCKRLYSAFTAKGYDVFVYGHAQYQSLIVQNMQFKPLFKAQTFADIVNYDNFIATAEQFRLDLIAVNPIINDNDLLIFHSIDPTYLLAIVDWLLQVTKQKQINANIFFQIPPAESKQFPLTIKKKIYYTLRYLFLASDRKHQFAWLPNKTVQYYQQINTKLKKLLLTSKVQLLASTDVLADNFAKMLDAPVHQIPMPGFSELNVSNHKLTIERPNAKVNIKIGYFGHASQAKGGNLLPYIVSNVIKKWPHVEFILHINPNFETEKALLYFKQTLPPQVNCQFGHLQENQLLAYMQAVDIILLPYSQSKYALTPSAIFMEAIMLNKVVVIPENTWMHSQAKQYDLGFTGFKRHNKRAVLQATQRAIDDFTNLENKTEATYRYYYRDNCMQTYINAIERIVSAS